MCETQRSILYHNANFHVRDFSQDVRYVTISIISSVTLKSFAIKKFWKDSVHQYRFSTLRHKNFSTKNSALQISKARLWKNFDMRSVCINLFIQNANYKQIMTSNPLRIYCKSFAENEPINSWNKSLCSHTKNKFERASTKKYVMPTFM